MTASCRRLDLTVPAGLRRPRILDALPRPGHAPLGRPRRRQDGDAPIVLCPVELHRSGTQAPYYLERTEDDVVRQPGSATAPGEVDSPSSCPTSTSTIPTSRASLGRSALGGPAPEGWEVEDRTVLTTFSFHKEAIYRDLEEHEASVVGAPDRPAGRLGRRRSARLGVQRSSPAGSGSSIDDEHPPEDLVSILDADSSASALASLPHATGAASSWTARPAPARARPSRTSSLS